MWKSGTCTTRRILWNYPMSSSEGNKYCTNMWLHNFEVPKSHIMCQGWDLAGLWSIWNTQRVEGGIWGSRLLGLQGGQQHMQKSHVWFVQPCRARISFECLKQKFDLILKGSFQWRPKLFSVNWNKYPSTLLGGLHESRAVALDITWLRCWNGDRAQILSQKTQMARFN